MIRKALIALLNWVDPPSETYAPRSLLLPEELGVDEIEVERTLHEITSRLDHEIGERNTDPRYGHPASVRIPDFLPIKRDSKWPRWSPWLGSYEWEIAYLMGNGGSSAPIRLEYYPNPQKSIEMLNLGDRVEKWKRPDEGIDVSKPVFHGMGSRVVREEGGPIKPMTVEIVSNDYHKVLDWYVSQLDSIAESREL